MQFLLGIGARAHVCNEAFVADHFEPESISDALAVRRWDEDGMGVVEGNKIRLYHPVGRLNAVGATNLIRILLVAIVNIDAMKSRVVIILLKNFMDLGERELRKLAVASGDLRRGLG